MEDYLLQVKKPARYLGREWNSSKKDLSACAITFALCFPDLYEVGMSNIGIRILYGLLNSLPHVACERFFSVDSDMESILRLNQKEIASLESGRPLREFDIAGFSINHELCFTNVLALLDLGNVPLKSCERSVGDPLVIAGGSCAMNPEPLHEFFDLFVIGEGEEVIVQLLDLYQKHRVDFKNGKLRRNELLGLLASIEGIYVPSLYSPRYASDATLEGLRCLRTDIEPRIKKRFVKDLDSSYYPSAWLVPYIQIIHDRIGIELTRGCPHACRFCQAREQFYPLRRRSPDAVLRIASECYRSSGYEEIALGGLSVSDYPDFKDLVNRLIGILTDKKVSISLPSLKPQSLLGEISDSIATVKKSNLTFAPEAATERLRNVIGKQFDMRSFQEIIKRVSSSGYRHVKLYFMIGLPAEQPQDLEAIADFVNMVSHAGSKPLQVNVSINAFIPKPHTSLQWCKMVNLQEIQRLQQYIRGSMKDRRIKLNFHNGYMSFLEGVFSRGDRRLSGVILSAFKRGARFDAWENCFSFEKWQASFLDCGIDPESYLAERSLDAVLPWDFIETGTAKQALKQEANKVIAIIRNNVYNKSLK